MIDESTNTISNQPQNSNKKYNLDYKIIQLFIIFLNRISYHLLNPNYQETNHFDDYEPPYGNSYIYENNNFYEEYNDFFSIKPKIVFIKKNNNSFQLVKQLKNGYLIYYKKGTLYIYDQYNNYIDSKNIRDISFICELKNDTILAVSKDKKFYKIPIKGKAETRDKHDLIELKFILELAENKYIISCKKGTYYFKGDILSIKQSDLDLDKKITDVCYTEGQIIDKRIFVLINNKDNKKGNLHIYDIYDIEKRNKKKKFEIKNWSPFINNSLSVVKSENNNIVLLGYKQPLINGILAIKIKSDNNEYSINHNYVDTELGDDYIYPLNNFKNPNLNELLNINYNDLKLDTNYILVGGNKNIKIFMLKEEDIINIRLVCEIKLMENYEYKISNITSIVQLYGNGNIIIGSESGQNEFYLEEG